MPTHDKYSGIFFATDSNFVGHLDISDADTILKLVGNSKWQLSEFETPDTHGVLSNGKKASLLYCVPQGYKQHNLSEATQVENFIFPNYIVVGNEFIRSDERAIRAIRYHFENVSNLLCGYKTFQSLHLETDDIRHVLELDHSRSEKIAEQHGWQGRPFEPEIGDHPSLLYFSGLWEIIASNSNVGKLSLTNHTSHGSGSSAGIGITNEVTVNIEFNEPRMLDEAVDALQTIHSLFELILGHRQRYIWIELELTHPSKDLEFDMPQTAWLHWSLCNERVNGNSKASLHDVLLSPDLHPEEFSKVAQRWMDSAHIMGDPRVRFATAFFGGYGIDRIVGAANMFDLLPDSHVPQKKEVDAVLGNAIDQCRKIFSDLPNGFARQSVLSSLGRIGKPSLRDKIYHRADKIIAMSGGKFPDLYLPCSHAVVARNHYVHGSDKSFDYQENFTAFVFLTETLEFVFAASDLLDLGWDLNRWMSQGSTMTHPFGAYIVNYKHNIAHLKALVEKTES